MQELQIAVGSVDLLYCLLFLFGFEFQILLLKTALN